MAQAWPSGLIFVSCRPKKHEPKEGPGRPKAHYEREVEEGDSRSMEEGLADRRPHSTPPRGVLEEMEVAGREGSSRGYARPQTAWGRAVEEAAAVGQPVGRGLPDGAAARGLQPPLLEACRRNRPCRRGHVEEGRRGCGGRWRC